jgi:prolyl oligopeptidase
VDYPVSHRDNVVDVLHGHPVTDPYRWLEDPDSAETAAWVEQQNAVTDRYLASLPDRSWFAETMQAVVGRPRAGVPFKRAGWYFVSRNDGTQNQDVVYVARTLTELLDGGRVLVDPNTLSADGTSSLTTFDVARTGGLAAYGRSDAGSDWTVFNLIELATGEPVDEPKIQTKFSTAEWLPDGRSYIYTHFEHPGRADGTETAALPGPALRLHRIGNEQDADELILRFPDDDQLMVFAEVTADER